MLRAVLCVLTVSAATALASKVTNVHELCTVAEAHAAEVDGWVAEVCNAYQIVAKAEMMIETEAADGHADAKRKNEFIRFGKRKNEFIRFGKRKNEFIRFGKRAAEEVEAADGHADAKRKNEFIRFGKRKNEFIRFGKRAAPAVAEPVEEAQQVDKKKNEFIRFGKRKNEFIRFG